MRISRKLTGLREDVVKREWRHNPALTVRAMQAILRDTFGQEMNTTRLLMIRKALHVK